MRSRVRLARLSVSCLSQHVSVSVNEHRAEGGVAVIERFASQVDAALQLGTVFVCVFDPRLLDRRGDILHIGQTERSVPAMQGWC